MKNQRPFTHLSGDRAYLIFWLDVFDCQIRLSSIMAIYENFEVIVDNEDNVQAYRFDHLGDMREMVIDDGEWQIYMPERLTSYTLVEVQQKILMILMMKTGKNKIIQ